MTAVRLCSLNVSNGVVLGADEQQEVRLYWCVLNLKLRSLVFDEVCGGNLIFMYSCLSKYTTMATTAVRLCSLNVWNGVVFGRGRSHRPCVRICVWLNLKFLLVFGTV